MKSVLIAAFGIAVASLSPARADTIMFSVPLFDFGSTSATPDGSLTGTLNYDNTSSIGSGTFTLVDNDDASANLTNVMLSGFAMAGPSGTGLGVTFSDTLDVPSLQFSLNLAPGTGTLRSNGVGTVIETTAGLTYFYDTMADPNTGTGPGTGPGTNPGNPGTSVPGVPLPASAPMFGGALLVMGFAGLGRRLRRVNAGGGRVA